MTACNYNIIIYDIIELLILLNFFTNFCFLVRYWIIWTLMK